MKFLTEHPSIITLLASELFLVIVRSREITTLIKKPKQRTKGEQLSVVRGLLRSILLEIFLFVPASAVLLLILLPLIRSKFDMWFNSPGTSMAGYALVGLISYGFPFAAVRRFVTNVALNALKEFANLKDYEAGAIAPHTVAGKEGADES